MDTSTPIAVIGIGCRFPGGVNSTEKFWDLLETGRDTWTPVPADRWNEDSFFHSDPEFQGMQNHRGGHFIDQDISAFDGSFFGLPSVECESLDPQQRIQLEVACESLENAGLPLEKLQGSDTAVYVATFGQDYNLIQHKDIHDIPKYHTTGTGIAITSNRISYLLNLRGPSVTIDTGCSGSLVAIHQACQSLRTRECSVALAGGVNLMLSPDQFITMSLMRCWNEDGKSYSFDDRGTGYGRGEGAAMVTLKRLDDAIRDGDYVRAVIRSSGVNQDGKTNGIMVPNPDAQIQLIKSVYETVRLDPSQTDFVETHGTGTLVGDPLEFKSIKEAFASPTRQTPLYLGTVKPNIGHLESASGIAGFIKAVLMLEHKFMPPTINIQKLKPAIELESSYIEIPRALTKWPEKSKKRVSVNSFGYGGTNAHVILDAFEGTTKNHLNATSERVLRQVNGIYMSATNGESSIPMNGANKKCTDNVVLDEASSTTKHDANDNPAVTRPQLIVLSARSHRSLTSLTENLRSWITTSCHGPESILRDIAFTLSSRRSQFEYRVALVASSLKELHAILTSASIGSIRASSSPNIIYVFTGQGAQWFAMGKELMSTIQLYRKSMKRSDESLRTMGAKWSLVEEMMKEESKSQINDSELSQPATTALQIALIDLLAGIGIRPSVVVGHSSGEIAAAYAAGVLDQDTALKIAFHRGKLTATREGAMIAVGLGEHQVLPYLAAVDNGKAMIACANSPFSTTVSGDRIAIFQIELALKSDGVFARRLIVERAYHSHHMEDVASEYLEALGDVKYKEPRKSTTFISSVTGTQKTNDFGSQYWVDNLVSKVRFEKAFTQALKIHTSAQAKTGPKIIVEVGPHSALAGPIRQNIGNMSSSSNFHQYSVLVRNRDAVTTFSTLVTKLYEHGSTINVGKLNQQLRGENIAGIPVTSLPPYPWDHSTKYWHESRLSKEYRFRRYPYHDLLGIRIPGDDHPRPTWRHIISLTRLPWLREHVVGGEMLFPAAGYICMVLEASHQLVADRGAEDKVDQYLLSDVNFVAPLIILESGTVELRLKMMPLNGSEWDEFRIASVGANGLWTEHCHGMAMTAVNRKHYAVDFSANDNENDASPLKVLDMVRGADLATVDVPNFYLKLRGKGNVYGRHFSCLKDLRVGANSAWGSLQIPDVKDCMPASTQQPHIIHPAVLDALLHPSIAVFDKSYDGDSVITASISSLAISSQVTKRPGMRMEHCTTLQEQWTQTCITDIHAFQPDAYGIISPVISLKGLGFRALVSTEDKNSGVGARRDTNYHIHWGPDVEYVMSTDIAPAFAELDDDSIAQSRKLQTLNQASALFIDQCMRELERRIHLKVTANHQRLFDWMKRFYTSSEFKKWSCVLPIIDKAEFLDGISDLGVEGEVLHRIGSNLASILTGKKDPLSLIAEEDLLWRLYADDASVRCYEHMINYLKHLVFKYPNMAVLEVGAGTAAATEPLLEALSIDNRFPFKSYDFTDVSSAFFERSRKKLQRWERNIDFRKYDLQGNAAEQGFQEGTYDLILASNVLHVASSMDKSLSQLRRLLRPGGRIVMIETTRNVPFYNTCIGVLPGWWAASEDWRLNGPLLSEDQWNNAFIKNGLGGTGLVVHDYEGTAHRCSMITSKPIPYEQGLKANDMVIDVLMCPSFNMNIPPVVTQLVDSLKEALFTVKQSDIGSGSNLIGDVQIVFDNGERPILSATNSDIFEALRTLVTSSGSILWISVQEQPISEMNPEKGLIVGFARTARTENKALNFVTLDIQQACTAVQDNTLILTAIKDIIHSSFMQTSTNYTVEHDYIFKHNQLEICRVIPDEYANRSVASDMNQLEHDEQQLFHQPGRPLCLATERSRFIDKLQFREDKSLKTSLDPLSIEVSVRAFGVNFKDVLIAAGHIKQKLTLAGEFSGVVTSIGTACRQNFAIGDRVCGYGSTPYASTTRIHGAVAQKIPNYLSFAEAASIPVAFATAFYSLVDIAQLHKAQSILIHSAAGGVGQAAITIAQWIGAEVYATVSSITKKSFLMDRFAIPEDHIISSRSNSFKDTILSRTKGNGVDVVLNSLSGQALQDSLACVASFGTFVELGKKDVHSGTRISMSPFNSSITLASVDLSLMYALRPQKAGQLIRKVIRMIDERYWKLPGPVTQFSISEIGEAFRTMQNRDHIGKIVLIAEENAEVAAPARTENVSVAANGTYVIAGGLGGIGLELAKFLADNGAKHIVLLSRQTLTPAKLSTVQRPFIEMGSNVRVLTCDITIESHIEDQLHKTLAELPPVRGVIQCAVVLRDRVLSQMSNEDFFTCTNPKVRGTQNLIQALEKHTPDFFILFSSVIGGAIGAVAEANYAAANAFMACLANSKSSENTRFIAICPGAIDDVGIIADDEQVKKLLDRQGFLSVKMKQIVALTKYALGAKAIQRQHNVFVSGFDYQSLIKSSNSQVLQSPMFSHLLRTSANSSTGSSRGTTQKIDEMVTNAQSREEAQAIISAAISKKIGTLVAIDQNVVDSSQSVAELGVDSLVVVELKNWIANNFQANVINIEISDASSISTLSAIVADRTPLIPENAISIDIPLGKETERLQPVEIAKVKSGGLPRQPLPDLDASLKLWLTAVLPVLDENDSSSAAQLVEDFAKPGGLGRKLQERLRALADDPKVDNWQEDLYNVHNRLRVRSPLVPQHNFFGTHPFEPGLHSAAERAAIIAVACREFQERLEAGRVDYELVNEQIMDKHQYQWLFNTSREPCKVEDKLTKHPNHNYMVAFRYGYAFKVNLATSLPEIQTEIQSIMDLQPEIESRVGVLTTDGRNEWARNRLLLQGVSAKNAEWLHTIEAAAFVMYLDDAKPTNARERGHQFLHNDGYNRWCDKTMQFAISDNGWSAIIGEHSMIDGYTMRRINAHVMEAIRNHQPTTVQPQMKFSSHSPKGFAFETTPLIEEQIARAQTELRARTSINELVAFKLTSVSSSLFRAHKIPPKSGIQLAIQLASRKYFGHNPISHETVSLAQFQKGRVEISHTLWPEVKSFTDAMTSDVPITKGVLREHLLAAAKSHASNLMRCTHGHGIDRHLLCLEWSIRHDQGEEVPALFQSEIYKASRPRYLITDCLATGVLECGSLPGRPGGLWVHFEIEEDGFRFSVWGRSGEMDGFEKILKESMREIVGVLEESG
ncbi:hypothetical protein B0J11DRAFT_590366 [Dendryphion nanum]|uniref:Carrier domain-containing protein n=1 Tax=Dendryphion nanum TaxID=256645 RepID=A0A9P9DLT8_9PLEO|nr:hypothetical protein B0J11DRAFT_590366 [Dendryphion nanum]